MTSDGWTANDLGGDAKSLSRRTLFSISDDAILARSFGKVLRRGDRRRSMFKVEIVDAAGEILEVSNGGTAFDFSSAPRSGQSHLAGALLWELGISGDEACFRELQAALANSQVVREIGRQLEHEWEIPLEPLAQWVIRERSLGLLDFPQPPPNPFELLGDRPDMGIST